MIHNPTLCSLQLRFQVYFWCVFSSAESFKAAIRDHIAQLHDKIPRSWMLGDRKKKHQKEALIYRNLQARKETAPSIAPANQFNVHNFQPARNRNFRVVHTESTALNAGSRACPSPTASYLHQACKAQKQGINSIISEPKSLSSTRKLELFLLSYQTHRKSTEGRRRA